jgi:hypothetical protein
MTAERAVSRFMRGIFQPSAGVARTMYSQPAGPGAGEGFPLDS